MTATSIIIKSLSKSFENVKALEDISLDVGSGELFGFIGPDGAGKTTLFRILTTLLLPDSGSVSINGYDVVKEYKAIRNITGYMPGRFSLYQDLTVEENLNFYATVFGTSLKENYDLIKDVYKHIEPYKKRRAGKLSGGMKQKLALSCALIHRPSILILDEPTTGVDAVSRKEFWDMLLQLRGKDISILVSTPYMDEAVLCDRVALIQQGKLLSMDPPSQIIESYDSDIWSIRAGDLYSLKQDLESYENTRSAFLFGREVHITLHREKDGENELRAYLAGKNYSDFSLKLIKAGIEDCFMELMGR